MVAIDGLSSYNCILYSDGLNFIHLPHQPFVDSNPEQITSYDNLQASEADILVVAIGKPQFVKKDWVKPGAVVIDCGINSIQGLFLCLLVCSRYSLYFV